MITGYNYKNEHHDQLATGAKAWDPGLKCDKRIDVSNWLHPQSANRDEWAGAQTFLHALAMLNYLITRREDILQPEPFIIDCAATDQMNAFAGGGFTLWAMIKAARREGAFVEASDDVSIVGSRLKQVNAYYKLDDAESVSEFIKCQMGPVLMGVKVGDDDSASKERHLVAALGASGDKVSLLCTHASMFGSDGWAVTTKHDLQELLSPGLTPCYGLSDKTQPTAGNEDEHEQRLAPPSPGKQ